MCPSTPSANNEDIVGRAAERLRVAGVHDAYMRMTKNLRAIASESVPLLEQVVSAVEHASEEEIPLWSYFIAYDSHYPSFPHASVFYEGLVSSFAPLTYLSRYAFELAPEKVAQIIVESVAEVLPEMPDEDTLKNFRAAVIFYGVMIAENIDAPQKYDDAVEHASFIAANIERVDRLDFLAILLERQSAKRRVVEALLESSSAPLTDGAL